MDTSDSPPVISQLERAPDTSPVAPEPPQVTQIVSPDSNNLIEALRLVELLRDGLTVREAGQRLNLSRSTAFRRLSLIEDDTERGVVKLLAHKGIDFAEDWVRASKIAADKGDHRPAKDALLAVKAIEPVGEGQGTNIAIIIGTPEHPIRISPPQVLKAE